MGAGSAHSLPPARISTACATARVSGIVSVKFVPLPSVVAHFDAAAQRGDFGAHDVHADAAAGDLRHLRRGRETRLEQEFDELRVGGLGIGGNQAQRTGALAHAREIDAGAVVGQVDHDFVADLANRQRYFAGLELTGLDARIARLDAVVERVAQQMLERTDQLFQHRAVEFHLGAVNFEVRALVQLLGGRAQDAVQALRQAAERHGANGEEPLLHFARQPRLRQQCGIGVVQVLEQRMLDGGHVVDAFGQRARQFLEASVPVEFERIEVTGLFLHQRHLRLDLRFRLDFDFAHLRAQPDHAVGQFEQVGLQRTQFAFDARTGDGDFAGFVDETVDDVGANAQLRARADFEFGCRFGRRGQRGRGHCRNGVA